VGLGRREQYFSSMTNSTTVIIENDGYNHKIIEKTMKHKDRRDKQWNSKNNAKGKIGNKTTKILTGWRH
jgi:hypothetical protein